MKSIITASLCAALVVTPMQSILSEQPPPPDQDMWLAVCVVAVAGLAVGAIYVVAKKCEPQYYWLMDSDQPPKFWVGTATRKECQIQGWKRIGGPYKRPSDAPTTHPDATNRVDTLSGPLQTIKVQQTTNLTHWTTVYETTSDLEDFSYYPTNQGMFRLEVSNP